MSTVAERMREAALELGPQCTTARLDAELLMAAALGVTRSELLLHRMTSPAPAMFDALLTRRLANEPVAYILGTAEFYGLELNVTPAVLIPRSDSETAIEAARSAFPRTYAARILDCGTGSGALLLAALDVFPLATGIGIDRSAAALDVAIGNADKLGMAARTRFAVRDWNTPGWNEGLGARFNIVLANPPYVEDDANLESVVRDHEPHEALFAGPEGLDAYRSLIPQLSSLIAAGGAAFVEIGSRQADAVIAIGKAAGMRATVHRDLGNRDRVIAFSPSNMPAG